MSEQATKTVIMKTKSVVYNVVPRKNPAKKEAAPKYYAQALATGYMDMEELTYRIERESTVSEADAKAVVSALERLFIEAMQRGQIVKLGELGTFTLALRGKGAMTEQDYSISLLKEAKIHFRPGKRLTSALKQLTFTKLPKPTDKTEESDEIGG